ncbi:MAG: hypothetical protein A2655_04610 [Candidatus Yanofskybacteria bacterium RIFCSPHIGHO2_01_FULL_43_42]|uniref:Uncharacterized protein n=1 Tax=Candidatus Yanofskybacteria bacterium RIFCSPLOWO2_01_FULL_43_22 TaxID=1802695 RepID=A0A1F8GEP2_9BACT|nr:MAG: hypothetical protein A2655_04610 [Candidatus Yanofskybacteria bacterium RIFCSPHIGHO2_01_FULL_43_42]OGN12813.1 MAG: hypothetical protein A3D48_01025 [Candidatus Yanofskybacteria bacterium RIFCSPHIGHO2_02_FULL_43_17]OGN23852.1 MAG: hypothetical protein A3A13_02040 [Candidatus Yanofskybacteria bacterium RIFCSPLOWO2_01_FULL_43_22]
MIYPYVILKLTNPLLLFIKTGQLLYNKNIAKPYPNPHFDIFEKETKKLVINLFYKKRLKKVRWTAALILIPTIIILNSYLVKAGLSYFYSPLCLGSWKNVRNIEGEPELPFGADASSFNGANSAVLKNSAGQIFCGNFNSSNPPENPVQKLKLRFSLAVVNDIIPEINAQDFQEGDTLDLDSEGDEKAIFIIQENNPSVSEPEPTPSPDELSPSSAPEPDSTRSIPQGSEPVESTSSPQATQEPILTPEIIPTSTLAPTSKPSVEPSATPTAEPMPESSVESTPETSPATPTPEPEPDSTSSPQATSSPSSLIPLEVRRPLADSLPTTPFRRGGPLTGLINVAQAEEPQIDEGETTPSLNLDDILEVSYTVDGENWVTLGRINRENWENISFDISNISLENIADLQIAVSSLPTLGSDITVYVDSMWLEAEYDSGLALFVKDVGETIIDTLTLQNLEPSVEDEALPKEPEPVPRVKIRKTVYDFLEKDVSNSSLKLKWYPADKVDELSRADIGSAQVQISQKSLEISGSCRLSYFVMLLYRDKDDYIKNPASAIYNAAFPCDGKFSHVVSEFPSHIDSGDYYILIAEQGNGSWRPISDIYKIEVNREITEEEVF